MQAIVLAKAADQWARSPYERNSLWIWSQLPNVAKAYLSFEIQETISKLAWSIFRKSISLFLSVYIGVPELLPPFSLKLHDQQTAVYSLALLTPGLTDGSRHDSLPHVSFFFTHKVRRWFQGWILVIACDKLFLRKGKSLSLRFPLDSEGFYEDGAVPPQKRACAFKRCICFWRAHWFSWQIER